MPRNTFFSQKDCDRCCQPLKSSRVKSYFDADATICTPCGRVEQDTKQQMKKEGIKPEKFKECGFVPDVSKIA